MHPEKNGSVAIHPEKIVLGSMSPRIQWICIRKSRENWIHIHKSRENWIRIQYPQIQRTMEPFILILLLLTNNSSSSLFLIWSKMWKPEEKVKTVKKRNFRNSEICLEFILTTQMAEGVEEVNWDSQPLNKYN